MKELYKNLELFGKFQWITAALFCYQVMINGFLTSLPTFTEQKMAHTCANVNEKYVSRETFKNLSKNNIDSGWSSDGKYFGYSINSDIEGYATWKNELGRYVSECRNSDGSLCKHLIYTSGKYQPRQDEEGHVFEGQGELSCMWDQKN